MNDDTRTPLETGDLVGLAEDALAGRMGTAHPDCDRALQMLAKGVIGLTRSTAKWNRKASAASEGMTNQLVKAKAYKHEIRKLEDLLAWVVKTPQPIEEIKRVVAKNLRQKLERDARSETEVPTEGAHDGT